MTVPAGPLSVWSLVAVIGWASVLVVVWLVLFAYGRDNPV